MRLTWDKSDLNILNNNNILNNHCVLLPKYQPLFQTDVNIAITISVVLYAVYLKILLHMLLNNEGKITLEQVMMTYTDSREMSLLFLTSLLIGLNVQCHTPVKDKMCSHFPYKSDSINVTACKELQRNIDETFNSKLRKQCLLYFDIEKCTKLRMGPNKIRSPLQSNYLLRSLKM